MGILEGHFSKSLGKRVRAGVSRPQLLLEAVLSQNLVSANRRMKIVAGAADR